MKRFASGTELADAVTSTGSYKQVDGLAYRASTTLTIEVEVTPGGTCKISEPASYASLTTTVPDPSQTYFLQVTGNNWTKSKVEYALKDGMPISLSSDQPSQAAVLAWLPIDILKAIVEVPAFILKLRVDYDAQAEALIKGQTDQLKAQLELLNAQQALQQARDTQTKAVQ